MSAQRHSELSSAATLAVNSEDQPPAIGPSTTNSFRVKAIITDGITIGHELECPCNDSQVCVANTFRFCIFMDTVAQHIHPRSSIIDVHSSLAHKADIADSEDEPPELVDVYSDSEDEDNNVAEDMSGTE
jgi:hypothetical protein